MFILSLTAWPSAEMLTLIVDRIGLRLRVFAHFLKSKSRTLWKYFSTFYVSYLYLYVFRTPLKWSVCKKQVCVDDSGLSQVWDPCKYFTENKIWTCETFLLSFLQFQSYYVGYINSSLRRENAKIHVKEFLHFWYSIGSYLGTVPFHLITYMAE